MNQIPVIKETELNMYKLIAHTVAKTPYWSKLGGEEAVLSIMLMGKEVGISPMIAISGLIHPVLGNVEISGKGMCYLIRKAGHTLKLKLLTTEKCTIEGTRKDTGEVMEASFTLEEARVANLIKPGGAWIKSPQDMLYWRAISRLARRLFTDCIGGCYIEGEIQETVGKKPMETIDPANLEEVEVEEVDLEMPEGISKDEAERYISFLSEQHQKSSADIKKAAQANYEEFWKTFKKWSEDQLVLQSMEEKPTPESEEQRQEEISF